MSVINTMLQDLEQRDGTRDLSKEEILQGLSSASAGMKRRGGLNPYMASAFSVMGVCAILLLAYLYSPYRLVDEQQQAQSQPAVATVSAAEVANTEIGKAVTGPASVVAVAERQLTQPQQAETTASVAKAEKPVETTVSPPKVQHVRPPVIVAATVSDSKRDSVNRVNKDTAKRAETAGKHNAVQTAAVHDETDADISKTEREPSNAEKSVNMYAHAMDMFSQGRTDESRLQLKQALALDPSNSKASQLLAAIYLGDNRPKLAVAVIDEGLKLRPTDQDMLRLYLQIQVQMKNYAQAINIMERRMRLNTPEDIAYLAGLHQKNKDHLGAARLYAQALKLKPSNSVWWMGQGISFEALGMNEEAMKSYQQSIESGRLNTQLAEYVLGRIASIEKLSKDPVS